MDYYYYKPGDRFYYFDLKNNCKTDKMGTVIKKVFDVDLNGVRLQLYDIEFDGDAVDSRRLGNSQMVPDYQELREHKLNELGI